MAPIVARIGPHRATNVELSAQLLPLATCLARGEFLSHACDGNLHTLHLGQAPYGRADD